MRLLEASNSSLKFCLITTQDRGLIPLKNLRAPLIFPQVWSHSRHALVTCGVPGPSAELDNTESDQHMHNKSKTGT